MGKSTAVRVTVLPWMSALLWLSACGVAPSPSLTDLNLDVEIAAEPELLAWAIGNTVLERWPGADDLPTGGFVPVLVDGESLTVEFATDGGLSSFAATAGLSRPHHRAVDSGIIELSIARAKPLRTPLRTRGNDGRFRAHITPVRTAAGTTVSHLRLRATDAAAEPSLWARVVRNCDLLDTFGSAAAALDSGRPELAAAQLHRVLDVGGTTPDSANTELSAPLWAALALARERLGALPQARAAAALACDAAPGRDPYAQLLVRLDAGSAHPTARGESPLPWLSRMSTDPRTRLVAGLQHERLSQRHAQMDEFTIAAASSDAPTDRARRALVSAERARSRAEQDLALLHSLEAQVHLPDDLDILEQVVDHAIAVRSPAIALRAIARAWPKVEGRLARTRLRSLSERTVAGMPPTLAIRVANSEACGELAALALEHCADETTRRHALAVVAVERTLRATRFDRSLDALATPPR
ncbi:MAG: hypothetical protein AB7I19_14085 [Planctomycetota bacterium]